MRKHRSSWMLAALLVLGGALAARSGLSSSTRPLPGIRDNYSNASQDFLPYSRFHQPYRRHFMKPLEFTGPGRDKPDPRGLKEILIGFLAPLERNPESFVGASMLKGAQLALEEANGEGGYRGVPFKLDVRNDLPLWGASGDEIVRFWDRGVWGIIGSVDGNNTHIALRVLLKAEIPLVNTAGTDPTLTETRIPWLLRTITDDRQNGYALAHYIHRVKGLRRVAALRMNARYGRVGIAEFRDTGRRMGHPLVAELRYEGGEKDFTPQLTVIQRARPDAVVVWGNPAELVPAIRQMRRMGLKQPIFAPDRLVSQEVLKQLGPAAEGLIATYPMDPNRPDAGWQAFRKRFRARHGEEPDHIAASTYDGARILFQAIREAGLNRARIMDALMSRAMKPYQGVSGTLFFNHVLTNIMPPYLAEVRNGAFRYFDGARWDLAQAPAKK